MVNLADFDEALVGLNPHLGDTLTGGNGGVAGGVDAHLQMVIFAGVGLVDDADAIGLEQTELLESGTPGGHDGFKVVRHLDRDAEVDELVFAGLNLVSLGGAQVNPLARMSLRDGMGGFGVVFYVDAKVGHWDSS